MIKMKSSNEIKQTVICRQLANMELKPNAMLIKCKTAVHACLSMIGKCEGLCLTSLCHSTLCEACIHIKYEIFASHTATSQKSHKFKLQNNKIASSFIKTILISFQISQVYNDCNQKAKNEFNIANTYVIDYLECLLFKSGVTQLLDFAPLDQSARQPFFLFFFAFAL